MPYITAQIIFQLLTVVIPQLEALAKEGESGQKKINQYVRYLTVVLALIQSVGYVFLFRTQGAFPPDNPLTPMKAYVIVLTLTVGTALIMWLGELITQRGIGNGISLMIFASIVSRLPAGVSKLLTLNPGYWILMGVISVAVVAFVIYVTEGHHGHGDDTHQD